MSHLAPVILFVYNRPHHTRKTIDALKKNKLSKESHLIVFSDGPKDVSNSEEIANVKLVREIIDDIKGFKTIDIHLRDKNFGLANSIITGVSFALKSFKKVIVLEDDIETSPYFLQYMNDALSHYEHIEKVMHVSGYMFPVKCKLPITFFMNTASCWGWGTWQRAWSGLILDSGHLIKNIYERGLRSKININEAYNHFGQLIENHEGKINTWAVFWHSTIILKNGLCLHPYPSLTNNIGNDSSGVNSKQSDFFSWDKLANKIDIKPIELKESKKALKCLKKFYQITAKKSIRNKIGDLVYKFLNEEAINSIKNHFIKNRSFIKELTSHPRYYSGEIILFNKSFRFIDSKSTLFAYKEIFQKKVYGFNSETNSPFIIDCGANIGLSILYFKRIFPHSKVIAFEPDEEIYDILEYNIIKSNKYDGVELINAALWSHNKGVSFHKEGADAGRIVNGIGKDLVNTHKLSDYINEKVDYLKMDIEGAEWEVLQECGGKLKNVQQMFIEYHSYVYRDNTLHLILELLSDLNFRYYLSTPGLNSKNPLIKPTLYAMMDMQVNIFAKNQS